MVINLPFLCQSLIVLSALPEARILPSGLNATETTVALCSAMVVINLPLDCQSLIVLSALLEARIPPSPPLLRGGWGDRAKSYG